MSRVLACDPVVPETSVIDEIVKTLNNGGVVVMPTETQYSLSVRGDKESALEKISAVKKRSETVKAALFVKDLEMARRFCEVDDTAEKLATEFLPGPLTLVLPGIENQNAVANGFLSGDGFGIRISSSPVIISVMDKVSFAVTATSANLSGNMAPDNVGGIQEMLGDRVDLYVDGGPCRGIVPSTVIKVADGISVLRHGIIPEKEIMRCLERKE